MLKEKVEKALNSIRPTLMADGGDVELIDVSDDGVVRVRLQGSCSHCPMSQVTLSQGIEARLKASLPEVTKVVSV